MALTWTNPAGELPRRVVGDEYEIQKIVAFDSSYPTGGEAFTVADLGFKVLPRWIEIETSAGYIFKIDRTNLKVIAYMGDNNNASDGPLIEVANTTDLSAVTGVRVLSRGKYAL